MRATPDLLLPENASALTRIRLGWRALHVLKNDPGHVHAGPLLNACLDTGVYRRIAAQLRGTEDGRRLLSERPSLQGPELDLAALERLPVTTFGHAVARYFRDNGITPFETTFPIRNDLDYISKRYRETHDFVHVLTGYATDVAGEMEVQAFALGNLGIRSPVLIISFATLLNPIEDDPIPPLRTYARRLRRAHRRGARSPSLLRFAYEQHWESSLAELQAARIAPG